MLGYDLPTMHLVGKPSALAGWFILRELFESKAARPKLGAAAFGLRHLQYPRTRRACRVFNATVGWKLHTVDVGLQRGYEKWRPTLLLDPI